MILLLLIWLLKMFFWMGVGFLVLFIWEMAFE
jgi:hypothetical protein